MKKGVNMRKFILFLITILFFIGCTLPEDVRLKYGIDLPVDYIESKKDFAKSPDKVTINGIDYARDFYDEFTDSETLNSGKWDRPSYQRRGTYWLDEAIVVQNDALEVQTKVMTYGEISKKYPDIDDTPHVKPLRDDTKLAVTGALLKKDYDKYGLFVARIKMKKRSAGHWNAFWLYGMDTHDNDGKKRDKINIGYEYDIFEYPGRKNKFDQTTHWVNYNVIGERISQHGVSKVKDISEWNTYALLWTENEVVYYVNWEAQHYFTNLDKDGEVLSSSSKNRIKSAGNKIISDVPLQLNFSNEVAQGVGWAQAWAGFVDIAQLEKEPDVMYVDYYAHYVNN